MSLRFLCRNTKSLASLIAGCAIFVAVNAAFTAGEDETVNDKLLPQPVTAESFSELKSHSPFRRSVDFSDSLVLTGMARIEGAVYATLFNSDSTQSHVVSETANQNGWQLVGVRGDEEDLESLTAKIQVDGGEVVSIRYQKVDFKSQRNSSPGNAQGGSGRGSGGSLSQEQIEDARRAARDPGEGFRGDGYRGPPPPEIMEKLKKISTRQREEIARRIMQMRNNGVDSDERRRIYNEALDRAVSGR